MKEFLTWENARNRRAHKLFSDILREAYGDDGVLIAHHLCFGSEDAPNEIPSADTLIFDHDIARQIFGENFTDVLTTLALAPASERDDLLSAFFYDQRRKVA